MANSSRGPLSGIRVLEATHMLAGPYCGMLLADLGADVIKIEPPGGDIARRVGPHFIGPHNVYFASLNRNKRSVCLDLATPDGQAKLGKLATTARGLITNMRPAAIGKLGLTYASLKAHNSRIACLALTGYGLEGPEADMPAYDYAIQAMTGVMALTGDPGGPPTKVGYSAVDNSTGIMAALALVSAILEGKGGQIEVSLHDTMLSQLNYLAGAYLNAGEVPARQSSGAHPYIVPAQIFPTRDGHLALFITHDEFWHKFALELEQPAWLTDPDFATMAGRSVHRDRVIAGIEAVLRTDDTQAWVDRLRPLGVVIAGVTTLDKSVETRLVVDRAMVVTIPGGDGDLRVIGCPIKGNAEAVGYARPPLLGEHNDEIFRELEAME
ncbi:crotonobetainyl-CoA:carnitine CoA-transferase CaiB-like acyl-CoA transferase [Rhodoligotrophos appendicifer]|uniref:CaiB/BaiF CoA transferase family protein n=1 Tax=Rhodoligotrophos appendicifer TaxID=987056 RepID=UPI001185B8CE|nr:CoA transferase [Rhodoligotrophos appendicifer]